MTVLSVSVFGPESVSYERSRLENRTNLRHFSARVFFEKIPQSQYFSISKFPGYRNGSFSSISRFPGNQNGSFSNISRIPGFQSDSKQNKHINTGFGVFYKKDARRKMTKIGPISEPRSLI